MSRHWLCYVLLFVVGTSCCDPRHIGGPARIEITQELKSKGYIGMMLIEDLRDVEPAFVVSKITEGSPAEKAGLQVGDSIVAVDGEVPVNLKALHDETFHWRPGDTVRLTFMRQGDELSNDVELTDIESLYLLQSTKEFFECF